MEPTWGDLERLCHLNGKHELISRTNFCALINQVIHTLIILKREGLEHTHLSMDNILIAFEDGKGRALVSGFSHIKKSKNPNVKSSLLKLVSQLVEKETSISDICLKLLSNLHNESVKLEDLFIRDK